MELIQPGYTAPVEEGENFGTYDAISKTVEEHNQNAAPGEKYWGISIENSTYTVYEYGEVPTPPTEEEAESGFRRLRSGHHGGHRRAVRGRNAGAFLAGSA